MKNYYLIFIFILLNNASAIDCSNHGVIQDQNIADKIVLGYKIADVLCTDAVDFHPRYDPYSCMMKRNCANSVSELIDQKYGELASQGIRLRIGEVVQAEFAQNYAQAVLKKNLPAMLALKKARNYLEKNESNKTDLMFCSKYTMGIENVPRDSKNPCDKNKFSAFTYTSFQGNSFEITPSATKYTGLFSSGITSVPPILLPSLSPIDLTAPTKLDNKQSELESKLETCINSIKDLNKLDASTCLLDDPVFSFFKLEDLKKVHKDFLKTQNKKSTPSDKNIFSFKAFLKTKILREECQKVPTVQQLCENTTRILMGENLGNQNLFISKNDLEIAPILTYDRTILYQEYLSNLNNIDNSSKLSERDFLLFLDSVRCDQKAITNLPTKIALEKPHKPVEVSHEDPKDPRNDFYAPAESLFSKSDASTVHASDVITPVTMKDVSTEKKQPAVDPATTVGTNNQKIAEPQPSQTQNPVQPVPLLPAVQAHAQGEPQLLPLPAPVPITPYSPQIPAAATVTQQPNPAPGVAAMTSTTQDSNAQNGNISNNSNHETPNLAQNFPPTSIAVIPNIKNDSTIPAPIQVPQASMDPVVTVHPTPAIGGASEQRTSQAQAPTPTTTEKSVAYSNAIKTADPKVAENSALVLKYIENNKEVEKSLEDTTVNVDVRVKDFIEKLPSNSPLKDNPSFVLDLPDFVVTVISGLDENGKITQTIFKKAKTQNTQTRQISSIPDVKKRDEQKIIVPIDYVKKLKTLLDGVHP